MMATKNLSHSIKASTLGKLPSMKKCRLYPFLLSLSLLVPAGCARAEEPSTQTAVPDAWSARKALYDYDAKAPLNDKLISEQPSFVATTKKFTFKGAQGDSVPAYVVLPVGASETNKVPAVVLLHGKGGRIEEMIVPAQFLATRGYASVFAEIVGHGTRKTADSTNMFGGDAKVLRDSIVESVQDIRRSIDLLEQQPEIDSQRIGLFGVSLGAIMGSIVTGVDERIKTSVLVVGGGNWPLLLRDSQEGDVRRWRETKQATAEDLKLLEDIDPVNFAPHIAPRPVLMLNGKQDNIVPESAAKALFEALKEPKEQKWFEANHFLPMNETGQAADVWLEEHLKNARAQEKSATPAEKTETEKAA